MKKSDAIAYFGTQKKLADALGISQPAVAYWGEEVPQLQAYRLEKITNGKLKADEDLASHDAA
ncbi:Cro/CI family transcriptional regulator [Catenovulum sediminis]|uniref:Cro/CI family transcriptional regulator n=1 Tax=Catenovulum sediminis TaxID=1740262 RepID=A0ABV1RHC0_9ALTE